MASIWASRICPVFSIYSTKGITHDYGIIPKGTILVVPDGYKFNINRYIGDTFIDSTSGSGIYEFNEDTKTIIDISKLDDSDLLITNAPEVYTYSLVKNVETIEVYHVGVGKRYTSFTSCIRDLKDNENEKVIYVHAGSYNIFSEIGGSSFALSIENETNWVNVCDIVPPNTKIIGLGYVEFYFLPTVDEIGYNASQLLSPLNISGSCTVENINIVAQNCRYCIHDETGTDPKYYGARKIYKNVRCFKLDAGTKNDKVYGKAHAYACGFCRDMYFEFDNCYFEGEWASFYMHNSDIPLDNSPSILMNNCISLARKTDGNGSSCTFTSYTNSIQHILTNLNSCYFKSNIKLATGSDSLVKNAYDVTLLHCNDKNVVIEEMQNQYNPHIYR